MDSVVELLKDPSILQAASAIASEVGEVQPRMISEGLPGRFQSSTNNLPKYKSALNKRLELQGK